MVQLIVNNEELDLYDREPINLNLQINDISNLSNRNSTYSNTITIPKTSKNIRIFEHLGIMGSPSRLPYEKIPCTYVRNNLTLIQDGYMEIKEITPNTIKVVLFEGLYPLADRLKTKTFSDINLSEFNHLLDDTTYEASFQNTSGYTYPIAVYNTAFPPSRANQPFDVQYQAPCMYLSTLWAKVFQGVGYRYTGDIFQTEDFLTKIVTPTNGADIQVSATTEFLNSYQSDIFFEFTDVQGNSPFLVFNIFDWTEEGPTNSGVTQTDTYEITANWTGAIKIEIDKSWDIGDGDVWWFVAINNVLVHSWNYNEPHADPRLTGTTFDTYVGDINDGDVITSWCTITSALWIDTSGPVNIIRTSINARLSLNLAIYDGTGKLWQRMGDYYNDVDQTKFVKDVMQHYGLIMRTTYSSSFSGDTAFSGGTVEFKTMESLLTDLDKAEDWTDKFNADLTESYQISGFGKQNWMRYVYLEGVENFDYDGYFTINNEHLEPNKTLFTSIYEIKAETFARKGETMFDIPLWTWELEGDGCDDEPITGNCETISYTASTKPGLFNLKYVDGDFLIYTIGDSEEYFYTGEGVPYLSLTGGTDINYQRFINTYYPTLNNSLDSNRILKADMFLNQIDIHNLDFFRLKYLKQTGKYYYLNSVKANSLDKVTVELVEVIPLTPSEERAP